jgi:hypothetical protein
LTHNQLDMKKLFVGLLLSLALLVQMPLANGTAISITAANFVPSANAVFLPGKNLAGETLTAGQAVYLDTAVAITTGQVKKASAIGTGLSTQVIGFAANGASLGQPVRIVIRDPGLTLGGTVTAGCVIYLGTAGAVTLTYADLTTGGFVAILGVGINATKINFGGTKLNNNFMGVVRADVALP